MKQNPIKRHGLGVCICSAFLAGCSANPRIEGVPPEAARVEMEAPVEEILRFDQPPEISAAAIGEKTLLIDYTAAGGRHFGRATRDAKQNISIHTDWFPVYYLAPLDEREFAAAFATSASLPAFDADLWEAFRKTVFEELTPREPGAGALLNYRDIEYFWYRGDDGRLFGTDLKTKPPGVPIVNSYRIEAMTDSLFGTMERFLASRDIDTRRMIIATGETGPYARPFIILDLDIREFGFLSLEPFTFGSMPGNYVVKGGKVGEQIVRSYVFEPFNRPVSFVSRLFFFATDSVADLSRRVYVNRFAYPRVKDGRIPPLNAGPGMDIPAWEARLDEIVGGERFAGSIEVLVDGDAFFPRLIDSVIEASESVKMRTYIFDGDDYAVALADLLKRRSAELDIQVMLDGLGTLMAQDAAAGTMPEDHQAPLGITNYLQDGSRISLRSLTNPWTAGDHTKTTIVDSDHAYIGGMNIGREYRWEWHDLMLRVDGPIVAYIEREFDKTWAQGAVLGDFVFARHVLANPMPASDVLEYPIRPLLTLPRSSEIFKAQVAAIRSSRSYIYLQNAYLADAVIVHELAMARLRGVDVRVILPMEGNHGVMNANNVLAANKLLRFGVRVFAYPGMSHIKAAIYDGWACVGSANFDKLSFQVNKEMNLGSADPAFVRELISKVFDPDFDAAVELEEPLPAGWKNSFASIVASQL